jgi:hypothetical protein
MGDLYLHMVVELGASSNNTLFEFLKVGAP